jgi:probable HAF family extracellular repeat protein
MRTFRGTTLVVACLLAGSAFGLSPQPVAAAEPTFDILAVPTLPSSYGYSVSAAATGGQVVGQAYFLGGGSHPFYFDGTAPVDLGTFGGSSGYASDVNTSGTVVGYAETETGSDRAFVWDAGVMTNLGPVDGAGTRAVAINEAGQIAGSKHGPNGGLAILWDGGVPTELGTLGGNSSYPVGITADGVVVGQSLTEAYIRVFVYDGSIHDLGALPGYEHNFVSGVTANGLIFGYGQANNRNCPWEQSPQIIIPCRKGWISDVDGPLEPIASPSSDPDHYVIPIGANETGKIVGIYLGDDTCSLGAGATFCQHGFLLDDGVMTTLPGYGNSQGSSFAGSINAQNDILGGSDGHRLYRDNVGYYFNDLAPDLAQLGFAPFKLADDGVVSGTTGQNQLYMMVPAELDISAPVVELAEPADGAIYTIGQSVTVAFTCDDGTGSGVATCVGDQPNGSTLDTSTAGQYSFDVTTTDNDGRSRTVTHAYEVSAGDLNRTVHGSDQGPVVVSTDPSGSGASPDVPIQTSVQFYLPSDQQATVAIDLHAPDVNAPSGYQILGQQVDIDVTGVNQANGLTLTFVIDSSLSPDPSNITMARYDTDGTFVFPTCASLIDPENCYEADFVAGPGSDVRLTIMTVHASKWVPVIRVDATPPSVAATVTGTMGSAGWYRSNASVSWSVQDPESTISSQSGCGSTVVSTDTAGTTFTCTATSTGGTTSRSTTVKRDVTPPSLTCQAATFTLGATSGSVSAVVADGLSGPLNASVSGVANLSSVGLKSLDLTGADLAGNTSTKSCAYRVGYRLDVAKPKPASSVKRGTNIPISFTLGDAGGRPISDSVGKAVAGACAAKISFSGDSATGCAAYDAKSDSFSFDLKTSKSLAPGAYVITIRVFAGNDMVNEFPVPVSIKT